MKADAVNGPRKLSVKADDSNELEADEIASQGQNQQWALGQVTHQSRPRTAIGLRPSNSPVEAEDS
jgi:hypothetical protein